MSSTAAAPSFTKPTRQILSPVNVSAWLHSEAYTIYTKMLMDLNECVKRKSTTEQCTVSPAVQSVIGVLDKIGSYIADFPPKDLDEQRFGNKAFRDWHAKVTQEAESLLAGMLPDTQKAAAVELAAYFLDSFGNATRIDYGSGHEACFIMMICCLFRLNFFTKEDSFAVVIRLFDRYMKLVRQLQRTYRMEPAGSHGVHSLDDYQFVPFIWGSAQLIDHPRLSPESFVNEQTVDQHKGENLFFDCVQYINETKTGPFAEHSNQLWNISAVPSWTKVNSGLFKMYEAEVLKKFPVIQHFLFGSLLPFNPLPSSHAAADVNATIASIN